MGLYNLKKGVATPGDMALDVYLAVADGALPIRAGTVMIVKGSAAALTLAAPMPGVHDGLRMLLVSSTGFAHTVTNNSPGFNGAGASGDVATFGAAVGNAMEIVAYNGVWHTIGLRNVTLA